MRKTGIVLALASTLALTGCVSLSTPLDPKTVQAVKAACREAYTFEALYEGAKASGLISAKLQVQINGAVRIIHSICDDIPDNADGATVLRIGLQTAIITKALIDAEVFG